MTFTLPDIPREQLLPEGIKPRVFISYSRANTAQVGDIVQRLRDAYYDVWFDTLDIPGGEDWKRSIAKGIQSAKRVIFFMSPESCESEYCQGEVAHALKHDVYVIPIRINSKQSAADLAKVGLADRQYIDWADKDNEVNWKRLLDDHSMIPPPLERDIRRLQPKYERLHRRYLNTFFRPNFSLLPLSDIVDDDRVRGVPLTSVYVPLPVDMSVTIQLDKSDKTTITDWWVTVERSDTRADENIPDELRERKLRDWISLQSDEDDLKLLIGDVERQLIERAAASSGEFHPEQTWYMEAHDAANIQNRMVLTGIPGSGKSTFLKHLAMCLAGDQLKDKENANIKALGFWLLPGYTPVFIRLADVVQQEFPKQDDRADTEDFDLYLQKQLAGWHIEDYWEDLQAQLCDGSAIILLDGLDEVPNAVEQWRRNQIMDFVGAILTEYGKCRVIITSRPYAYDGTWKLDGFGQTTLIPLHRNRVYELAEALFRQLPDIEDAAAEAKHFINALYRLPQVKADYWNNPLQFTMGVRMWVQKRDQPADKRIPLTPSQLYDESVRLMLERWTKRTLSGVKTIAEALKLTPQQLRNALEGLAFQVQSDQGSTVKAATFGWYLLVEHIETCRDTEKREAVDYVLALDLLEQRAGLLASEQARMYRFQHLSYQEYLAACELAKPAHFPDDVVSLVMAQPGRWRNVVPLLWDIIAGRSIGDLQVLACALLPNYKTKELDVTHGVWEILYHLAVGIKEHAQVLTESEQQQLGEHLINLVEVGALSPAERVVMGDVLSEIGDTRPGVGVKDGVPDMVWLPVDGSGSKQKFEFGEFEVKPFFIAKYQVTYAQYQAFVEAEDGFNNVEWWRDFPSKYQSQKLGNQQRKTKNSPRDTISWYQSVAFGRWMTHRWQGLELAHPSGIMLRVGENAEIRLPLEWEWQWAAQAGHETRKYPWGDWREGYANTSEAGLSRTTAVGMYPQGVAPCGALDMSGNLWEWCQNNRGNPQIVDGYDNGNSKVLRGGSFNSLQYYAASSYRNFNNPVGDNHRYGLRLVVCLRPIKSL